MARIANTKYDELVPKFGPIQLEDDTIVDLKTLLSEIISQDLEASADTGTATGGDTIVKSITITDGGLGYTAGNLVVDNTGSGGTGFAGTYTVDGSGTINSITITNNGSGYTSAPSVDGDAGGAGATLTPVLNSIFTDTGKDWETNMWVGATYEYIVDDISRQGIVLSNTSDTVYFAQKTVNCESGAPYALKLKITAMNLMHVSGTQQTPGDWTTIFNEINSKDFNLGEYDQVDVTYPLDTTEVFTYSLNGTTTEVITVTYSDATKSAITSVVKS
jgi:hypothetical protein